MKKETQKKDKQKKSYVFYCARTLEKVGESTRVKDFLSEYLNEDNKNHSGIYRTNQLKDGEQAIYAYRGLIMRVKGKEHEVPFLSEEARKNAARYDSEWDVYDSFTHEVVERAVDIREFCLIHKLGKYAHVQLFKTNQYDAESKEHLLSSYKGYFIREAGKANQLIPFPEKDAEKFQASTLYVFYAAETLEIVGESDNVKAFMEEYLQEELKSYSGIYRTNQVTDGHQSLSAYRGLILRVKGKEQEVPFPSEEVRTSVSARRDNEWDVYDAFTHKIVERTKDIRDFCTKYNLGKNAHVQIYKTNHYDSANKKHLLPSYKGYFIRKADTGNTLVPFPEKKCIQPESYDVYEYSTKTLIGNYKDLAVFMIEKGLDHALKTHLRRTGKPDREDPTKPMANQYRGYFVRQVGNGIELPLPGELKHPTKGTGKVWCIFDNNLNIIERTNDLKAFAKKKGLSHYKPLYDTNRLKTTKAEDETKSTIMRFFKGYLIRSEDELKNWSHLPLPNPKNATDPDTSCLDLMVWNSNDDILQGRYIPSYQKTFGLDALDKEMLYELAGKFLSNPDASKDGYSAVFIKDMKPGNMKSDDTMEALAELEVILPKEVLNLLS